MYVHNLCVHMCVEDRGQSWTLFFRSHPPSFLKGFFLARNLASRPGCLVRKSQGYARLHLYHIWVSGCCGPNSDPYACIVNTLLSHLSITPIQGCTLQSDLTRDPKQTRRVGNDKMTPNDN